MRSSLLVFAIVALAGPTSSQAQQQVLSLEPQQLETEGAEDNEVAFKREGFAIGVGIGSALFLGSGQQSDARAGGGSFSLRVGTSAGENLLWFVQLDAAAYGKKNNASLLGLGAHYYLRERLWARGGVSLANIVRQGDVRQEDDDKNYTEGGLALVGGLGLDVYRRGVFAVDLELGLSHARYEDGTLSLALFQLMANWY
tara:strand:+ start:40338 stop:40934 length:597 start_codon:yes stop_codon:yes gene_type:complete